MLTKEDLLEDKTGAYYDALFDKLYNSQKKYLKPYEKVIFNNTPNAYLWDEIDKLASDEEKAYLYSQYGVSEVWKIKYIIEKHNCDFISLRLNLVLSFVIVRMLLDAITLLYAEYKHPFKVLYRVFNKRFSLNQIKLGGKQLNPSELRKEIYEEFGINIPELYKNYSQYVHPSNLHFGMMVSTSLSLVQRGVSKVYDPNLVEVMSEGCLYDMVDINNCAIKIIKAYMKWLKTNKPQLKLGFYCQNRLIIVVTMWIITNRLSTATNAFPTLLVIKSV